MTPKRSPLARWVSGLAFGVCLAMVTGLSAQAPKPAKPAPAPKAAPSKAPAAKPEPAKKAEAPPAPAAPAERDPFEPLVTKLESEVQVANLKLVGVLWDVVERARIRALVETPDGLGYYLRLNEEKFGGKVIAIDRNRVRFSIREQEPTGEVRVRAVELKLRGL